MAEVQLALPKKMPAHIEPSGVGVGGERVGSHLGSRVWSGGATGTGAGGCCTAGGAIGECGEGRGGRSGGGLEVPHLSCYLGKP